MLISKADLIVVGMVDEAQETEETVTAVLKIEKLLKGKIDGKTVVIQEIRSPLVRRIPDVVSKDIVANITGSSYYHGKYKKGMRIVLLLKKIEGTKKYRPLGSGTYNQHLCAFPIENHKIQTFYFRFAEDVKKFAAGEGQFICLINKTVKIEARFEREVEGCTRD